MFAFCILCAYHLGNCHTSGSQKLNKLSFEQQDVDTGNASARSESTEPLHAVLGSTHLPSLVWQSRRPEHYSINMYLGLPLVILGFLT